MSDPIDTVYQKNNQLSNFVISNATPSANGLMSASDKEKLNGIQSGATANPTINDATITTSGLMSASDKEKLNGIEAGATANSNISNATTTTSGLMSASDKEKLNGIEAGATANSNISNATTTTSGLMSASDKAKLNGIADSANNYVLPTASTSTKGGVKVGTQGLSVSSGGYLQINAPIVNPYTDRYMGAVLPGQGLELEDPNTGEISVKLARYIEHYDSTSILAFTCAETFRWNNIVYNSNSSDTITQRMMLTKDGDLGIGVNPGCKLHVSGSGVREPIAQFESTNDNCSVRIKGAEDVYLEIQNTHTSHGGKAYMIGMDGTNQLTMGYGTVGSVDNYPKSFLLYGPTGTVYLYGGTNAQSSSKTTQLPDDYWTYIRDSGIISHQHLSASYRATSLVTQNAIWVRGDEGIFVNSDSRIKKNIIEIKDDISLKKLRDISCCSYNYIDSLKRTNRLQIGFIAQQVKEHFPEAIGFQKNIIPNEMRIIENPQWTEINDGSNNKFKLTISDLQDVSGVKYRFYVSNDVSGNDEVMKETTGNSDNSFTFDNSYNNVYCYGKEVDDFHTLDKQKLFALNFSATQEIDRIQQQQLLDISGNTLGIQSNKNELDLLKLENQELTNKVTSLETELNNLKTIVESLVNNN